ncbi:hypothetical protein E1293_12225 [Actinomadura darangshiensis]|uniref:DUF2269 family protein n=1 Tax=Actinomadura darangshiensis TaxID=705336 RepID=A0A4R5BIV6_9ACTN|nr:hypothetical protein [Actinomadura darangshiensis]TDD84890.1 hypothetical protein E1293_12225 [Actinomadura darangshiensis]
MSTSDRILLFLHIGFAIFTLGPLTAATMSTPRYIRKRNVVVVRYLHRTTQIYGVATLGIFLFGLGLAQGEFDQVWLTVSMTLFVVALVLLLIVERDQRKAAHLLEVAAAERREVVPAPAAKDKDKDKDGDGDGDEKDEAGAEPVTTAEPTAADGEVAEVERGRLAAMSGVVALLWLVILVLMVWNG